MSSINHDEATLLLTRADQITSLLRAAKCHKEIADGISQALRSRISQMRRTLSFPEAVPLNLPKLPLVPHGSTYGISIHTGSPCLVTISPGGLRGIHKLEDLVAELVAAHVFLRRNLKNKKQPECPSYAFIVGALSALAPRNVMEIDLKRICVAAREEATALSAAAIFRSHAETLDDMQQGIRAVGEVLYRHDIISRHVAAALEAVRNLIEKNGNQPLKGEVIMETIRILQKDGHPALPASNSARWREVFNSAELSHLKQARRARGKSRHRDG